MIIVKSFDGTSLDDATYEAGLPGEGDAFGGSVSPTILDVTGGYQRYEGADVQGVEFTLEISVLDPTKANVQALSQLFRKGHEAELRIEWDGVDMVRDCAVISVHPMSGSVNVFVVVLFAADPRWRTPSVITETAALTATGQSVTITNPGNAIEDRGIIRLTPTTNKAASAAQRFRRYVVAVNRSKRALLDWPIDITNYDSTGGPSGGLDHAALTTTKSQADAKDVRVLVDGREVPRFLGEHANTDADSATMSIWIAIPWSAMQEAHLRAAITDVSPANGGELEVGLDEVRTWPKRGQLLTQDGEVISYTGWTRKNADGYSAFTGIRRGVWGTTAAASSAGDQVLRAEHKIEIIYGQTSNLTAPEARADVKPILDLASATLSNKRHEWINFFDDTYPARPGQWARIFEPRDDHASRIFLAKGSPAATIDFEHLWSTAPVGKTNHNLVRRAFPVGTSGAAGQLGFTRVLDQMVALDLLGVDEDGLEVLFDTIRGSQSSAAYASAVTTPFYDLAFYVRDHVIAGTPEVKGAAVETTTESTTVNATNAAGDEYQAVENDTDETMLLYGFYVMIFQSGAPNVDVEWDLYTDDGSGAPVPTFGVLGSGFLAANVPDATGTWLRAAFARPIPLLPGARLHLKLSVGAGTHSVTAWQDQPVAYLDVAPAHALKYFGDGQFASIVGAEENEGVTIDGVSVLLDASGIPSFAMMAESDCYELNGTIVNETTEQEIRFLIRAATNDEIEVDVGERTVRNLTTGEDGLLYGIYPSDGEAWISFVPGDNVLRLDETGLAGLTLEAEIYGRWE